MPWQVIVSYEAPFGTPARQLAELAFPLVEAVPVGLPYQGPGRPPADRTRGVQPCQGVAGGGTTSTGRWRVG